MFTRFTTTLMAGALALASVTAPTGARAGDDAGKVIAGLAVGAIIGAAIASNHKKQRHHGGHVARGHHGGHGYGYDSGHHRGYQAHHGQGHRRVDLPNACRVHKGHRSGYSGRCLGGYDYGYAALPSACAVRVGGHHGTIYRDGCLNRYGYY